MEKKDVSVREEQRQRQIQRLQIRITLIFFDESYDFTSDFDPWDPGP